MDGRMVSKDERNRILDALDPRIGSWFAAWWGEAFVSAAALGHPWRTIRYDAGLLSALNATGRPYRYTMRRKLRKAYRV